MKQYQFPSSTKVCSTLSIVFSLAFLIPGCGGHDHDSGNQGHGHESDKTQGSHAESKQTDGHGHGAAISITQYTEKSELFMEHAPLIKDVSEQLIVHLTRLSDFTPVTEGSLEVRLISQSGETYTKTEYLPARDGIFLPVISPPFSGNVRLELHLRSSQVDDIQVIEGVEVYGTSNQVPHEEAEGAVSRNEISFLKEQQWKIEFSTVEIEQRRIQKAIPAVATLNLPVSGQALLPAPASGIVRFADGDFVIETGSEAPGGQTLFVIEPDASWQAGLAKLGEEYQLARAEFNRIERLQEQNAVAEKRVLESKIRFDTIKAALDQLGGEASLKDFSNLRAISKAPFAGIIAEVYVKPGERVEAGGALALIINPDRLILETHIVPARLSPESPIVDAYFRPAGSRQLYRISELGGQLLGQTPLVKDNNGMAILRFLFENPGQKLFPGAKVTANLLTNDVGTTGVVLPNTAIHEEEGIPITYVQTEGETIEKRYPKLGVSDGFYTQVLSGIEVGERVVTRGATFIRLSALSTSEMGHGHAH